MKSNLLAEEESPSRDLTSIHLEEANELTGLSPSKYVDQEEKTFFQSLPQDVVKTKRGDIHVAIQGDRSKKRTAIVTLHDIGQNHISGFQSFFCFHQFKPLVENFTIYHLNFPGQHENAEELPQEYMYPSMEEMADCVEEVFQYYNLTNTICFGIGAGANVFTRLALLDPKHVECCILVNGTCTSASWSEWGYEKMSSHYLKTKGMTQFCEDFLLGHFFGKIDEHANADLVTGVRDQLRAIKHPRNLAMFIESFSKRTNIKIVRPTPGNTSVVTLKCGAIIITGDHSPSVDDTVNLNSRLDPTKTTWMKITGATSLVLEEQPTTVTNAIVLFLQGYGHVMKVRPPALSFTSTHEEIQGPPAIC